jgi:hypothetical protein
MREKVQSRYDLLKLKTTYFPPFEDASIKNQNLTVGAFLHAGFTVTTQFQNK